MRRNCLLIVFALVAFAAALFAEPRTVSRVGIVARPRAYSGRCPASIDFIASIHVTRPTVVQYQWVRSDGAQGQPQTVEIRGAGKGVSDRWELGRRHQRVVVWERLRVLSPTGIESPMARVTVNCH